MERDPGRSQLRRRWRWRDGCQPKITSKLYGCASSFLVPHNSSNSRSWAKRASKKKQAPTTPAPSKASTGDFDAMKEREKSDCSPRARSPMAWPEKEELSNRFIRAHHVMSSSQASFIRLPFLPTTDQRLTRRPKAARFGALQRARAQEPSPI